MVSEGGSTRRATRSRWRLGLGVLGALALALALLVALYAKVIDPEAFVRVIEDKGLDVLGLPGWLVAGFALALEAAIGMALLLLLRRPWVLVPATLLALLFVGLNAQTWAAAAADGGDAVASCGCFGNLVDRTPEEAFWQDLAMLVPPLALAWLGRPRGSRPLPVRRLVVVGAFTAGSLLFAWKAPEMDLDDLATRLSPGMRIDDEDLTVGGEGGTSLQTILPELGTGRHLVVMADVADAAFLEAVPALNDFAIQNADPRLWVLTPSGEQDVWEFNQTGPAFDVRPAPPELLRPLYRRLPRSFRVEDARVTATWTGLPPLGSPSR